ncbi:high mobility group B protein 2-like [Lucilia sericata]|uniref:high mobility group B protein 2-like n=1 Tax=Lucilia sericata TaxID=13632 RepID=UPI0018A842E8|nr:high mobility group B protein 2-like [Lucilia sericata]
MFPKQLSLPKTIPSKSSNPFFIFLHEFRQTLKENSSGTSQKVTQVAQMAGEKWRQMSNNDKLLYLVWARKNQQQKLYKTKEYQNNAKKYIRNLKKPKKRIRKQLKSFVDLSNYIN